MTQRIDPNSMATHWGLPLRATTAGARRGLSAGLWTFERPRIDFTAPATNGTYIVTAYLGGSADQTFVIDGRVRYRARSGELGTFDLVRPSEEPLMVSLNARYGVVQIYLPEQALLDVAETEFGLARDAVEILPLGLERDPSIADVAMQIRREMMISAAGSRLIVDALTVQLCVHLLRRWSNRRGTLASAEPGSRPQQDWRIRRAVEQLEDALLDDRPVSDMAAEVGISSSRYAALFKAATGASPHQWLIRRRIDRARELLGDPRRSITEIAQACGFASSQHFATVFRRHMGATPSAWRKERLR